ncbi:MAG: GNAT family N-acetyltransferase [Candidatus Aenigmarchaeota archaeon]|nr:GNAT family N-acetyltransferase [Candidatus Aenigmarchaeota archaeon]
MTEIEILTVNESKRWGELINDLPQKDIHFTSQYAQLFENYLKHKALLFVFKENDNVILYPFFIRKINDIEIFKDIEKEVFDIISPWYYGGPVSNITDKSREKEIFQNFTAEFGNFCRSEKIVSEFCRMHPFFKNHDNFSAPELEMNRKVVYIDLKKTKEEIWNSFKKVNRKAIRKAEKGGIDISITNNKSGIKKFYDIYTNSMERKEAGKFYFFNIEFFNDMFELLKDSATIFFAEHGGNVIVASLVLHKHGIAHDYLRGSDPEFLHMRPNNLIVKEIALWAKDNGNEIFDLGGGTSTDTNDPKLRFKSLFSKDRKRFFIYKKIHNKSVYDELCKKQCNITGNFPLYRCV